MTEFGRRQYYSASDRNRAETQGTMRWLAGTVAAIALIAGSFLGYRVFISLPIKIRCYRATSPLKRW